ncbi:SpoIIE family protein phosphatase [Streptomyces sp. SID3343]|nr:response regulator [Streptomyces sp. SID3343]MYV97947.1 SpoIIE family protein phosphatase [Streptomyces sp. SID3343]
MPHDNDSRGDNEPGGGGVRPAYGGESGAVERTDHRAVPARSVASIPVEVTGTVLRVLLIEDDAGDAFLVEELLADSADPMEIVWARSMAEAMVKLDDDIGCVLLDLGLPDAEGLGGLYQLLSFAPRTAVIVLTGLSDAHRGSAAVAAGAQDYLVKQEIDGSLLSRAIRYALERKRADESQRRLVESELRAQENARLERGLLPAPILRDPSLDFRARYRPGRQRALLGGDLYDAVQTADGRVHVMIGDVCGHGPDEAALGVNLRIAWRSLIFAGLTGGELLITLERIFEHERRSDEMFATLCMTVIEPDRTHGRIYLAGHPAPLLLTPDGVAPLSEGATGPALGLFPGGRWGYESIELGRDWSLLLYTDGLIEGRIGAGPERLGSDGLVPMIGRLVAAGRSGYDLIDSAVAAVEDLHGGSLNDDVAVLLLRHDPDRPLDRVRNGQPVLPGQTTNGGDTA